MVTREEYYALLRGERGWDAEVSALISTLGTDYPYCHSVVLLRALQAEHESSGAQRKLQLRHLAAQLPCSFPIRDALARGSVLPQLSPLPIEPYIPPTDSKAHVESPTITEATVAPTEFSALTAEIDSTAEASPSASPPAEGIAPQCETIAETFVTSPVHEVATPQATPEAEHARDETQPLNAAPAKPVVIDWDSVVSDELEEIASPADEELNLEGVLAASLATQVPGTSASIFPFVGLEEQLQSENYEFVTTLLNPLYKAATEVGTTQREAIDTYLDNLDSLLAKMRTLASDENYTTDNAEDLARSSSVLSPEIISERLAQMHVQRGEHDLAIAMYERLGAKIPEKSGYFAGIIEALRADGSAE